MQLAKQTGKSSQHRCVVCGLWQEHIFIVYVLISRFRLKPRHAAVQYVPQSMSDSEIQTVLEGVELRDFLAKVCPRYICMDNSSPWKVIHSAGHTWPNNTPHQLCWGDQEMETALNICASNFATENCIFYQQLMHVHSIIAMVSPSESPSSLSSPPLQVWGVSSTEQDCWCLHRWLPLSLRQWRHHGEQVRHEPKGTALSQQWSLLQLLQYCVDMQWNT